MHEVFRKLAHSASEKLGTPWAFGIALGAIVLWAISGPFLDFSTTWQLIINTATTVLTFLMVFLIQNTQNRDARAIQLKLDELIRAIKPARNSLIDIEDMEDEELGMLQDEFKRFREQKIAEIKKHREHR
jgi:low affinity Fe/Cu permease